MKTLILVLSLISSAVFANCDLSRFRWDCQIPIHALPSRTAHSLVYCGSSYGYISQQDYQRLSRYKRRNINMVFKMNGEYVTSPCFPAERY